MARSPYRRGDLTHESAPGAPGGDEKRLMGGG